jgi:hypothetical protein
VVFRDQTKRAIADADRRWTVDIGPFEASDQPSDLVVSGKNTLVVCDVIVGMSGSCRDNRT